MDKKDKTSFIFFTHILADRKSFLYNANYLTLTKRVIAIVNACKAFVNEAEGVVKLATLDKMNEVFVLENDVIEILYTKNSEEKILSKYNKFKSAARNVGAAGYSAARKENARIIREAIGIMIVETAPAFLIPCLGLLLSRSPIGPEWWISIFIIGIAVVVSVFPLKVAQARKRIEEAQYILNITKRRLSDLDRVLKQNNSI